MGHQSSWHWLPAVRLQNNANFLVSLLYYSSLFLSLSLFHSTAIQLSRTWQLQIDMQAFGRKGAQARFFLPWRQKGPFLTDFVSVCVTLDLAQTDTATEFADERTDRQAAGYHVEAMTAPLPPHLPACVCFREDELSFSWNDMLFR